MNANDEVLLYDKEHNEIGITAVKERYKEYKEIKFIPSVSFSKYPLTFLMNQPTPQYWSTIYKVPYYAFHVLRLGAEGDKKWLGLGLGELMFLY